MVESPILQGTEPFLSSVMSAIVCIRKILAFSNLPFQTILEYFFPIDAIH